MLKLKNITKEYLAGDTKVQALKGIDIEFRKSEFVSILGQSGCGKTTLLNIIGGLDDYTSGDLIINGKSTADFTDSDWDRYRNHSVGFVFQNYNLIPHQTVLANVELALTLSGVSKIERRKKAIDALEKVGLKDQLNKKPNQMSGGQMQRVAIARALVNDPDILLADEPTGALDSKTSVQIMEILKEVSNEKLVIMVTHNPELADLYSSRIINLLDGKITNDSNSYKAKKDEKNNTEKSKKTFMSFTTALSLSLNNLMTKKGRTFLTAFAGSIGIIGIALILSLSNGVQRYIDKVEEDTLSSYPLTIEETSVNMSAMFEAFSGINKESTITHDRDKIYTKSFMNNALNTLASKVDNNNLEEFKKYIESDKSTIKEYTNAIQYGYNLQLNIYNPNGKNGLTQVNPSQVLNDLGIASMQSNISMNNNDVFSELLDNETLIKTQYDLISGTWPKKYNEVILIVDKNNEVSDYTLYALGLKDTKQLHKNFQALLNGKEVENIQDETYTYDELLNTTFKLILNTDYYVKKGTFWVNMSSNKEYMSDIIAKSEDIKIVGIVRPNEEAVSTMTTGGIGYTSALKNHVIEKINNSNIAKEQLNNKEINIFTNQKFSDEKTQFNYNNLSNEQKKYLSSLNSQEFANLMNSYAENSNATLEKNLQTLGVVDLEKPSSINLFPIDFDSKEQIVKDIEKYNQMQKDNNIEENVITYSDLVGTMMNSVTSIIDIISYVLMAFVSISLVVSSIMIGIITYISVLERTKEIGILRSIGASKKDISRVFNAETFIIGFIAGLLGVLTTILLNIPINIIIKKVLGVSNIASLPLIGGIILIIISMLLTVIGGLIPAKIASKKDPVEALRTE